MPSPPSRSTAARTRSIAVIDLGDFSRPEIQKTAARFAQRKLGGQPLIIRMARRLRDCALVDEVFIVGKACDNSCVLQPSSSQLQALENQKQDNYHDFRDQKRKKGTDHSETIRPTARSDNTGANSSRIPTG